MNHYEYFDLTEWLYYLENRYTEEIQLGLMRMVQVAQILHLLKPQATVITVAGTNGKGSTVAALESIYRAANYQVGTYTSPHLLLFNERICVNQQAITDQQLCEAFCVIEKARGSIPLTYFEMTTLAALWHFKQFVLDLIILEVGMGGRLDATNIIDADLAIITSIDLDHQAYLGETLEAIGFEKAGILRKHKPFIFADKNPPHALLDRAAALHSPPYLCGKEYRYQLVDDCLYFTFADQLTELPSPQLHLNAVAAAVMASICLGALLPVCHEHLSIGIKNGFLPGRLQQVHHSGQATLFDVSHNPQAVLHLAQFIRERRSQYNKIHIVFSALKDKDIPGLVLPLLNLVDSWYLGLLDNKRAAPIEYLFCTISDICNQISLCYNSPALAYAEACAQASSDDLIVVYGSFFTVADVMGSIAHEISNEESLSG